MRRSKFNDDIKRSILLEKIQEGFTVQEICNKYHISPCTYHIWKRELESTMNLCAVPKTSKSNKEESLQNENKTLRRLYINLSAHNYELAKFLNN